MIKEFKAPGTILFGRAMAAQLTSELANLKVRKPVIIAQEGYLRKARKVGRMLTSGHFESVEIAEGADIPDSDCLILAGGKGLTDHYRGESRVTVHFPLSPEHLEDVEEAGATILVMDSSLIGKNSIPHTFFERYSLSMTGGILRSAPAGKIPESFTFHGRTSVFSGDRILEKLPGLLEKKGVRKPLILTDGGIIDVGLMEHVDAVIPRESAVLFSEIPPDSRIDVVNRISNIYREEKCDGIIAFGGGSVLDTGKGVYLNVSLGVDDLNSMVGSGHIPSLETPFIAVPTTSGTGSEVTKVAVVSDPGKGRKLLFNSDNLQPDYALLDSRLTASLPPFLTSITGMDALTHAVEAFTCLGKNPLSDHLAWTAVELIRDHLPAALTDPSNLEHRRALAAASNFAGSAFSNSMVGMVHTIGHSIGSVCHAPHGSCMSVLLPYALEYNYKAIEPLLAQLLDALAGHETYSDTPVEKRALRAIEEIRMMNRKLRDLTGGRHPEFLEDITDREGNPLVRPGHFQDIAETAMGDASIVYNPLELRKDDVVELLGKVYSRHTD